MNKHAPAVYGELARESAAQQQAGTRCTTTSMYMYVSYIGL